MEDGLGDETDGMSDGIGGGCDGIGLMGVGWEMGDGMGVLEVDGLGWDAWVGWDEVDEGGRWGLDGMDKRRGIGLGGSGWG